MSGTANNVVYRRACVGEMTLDGAKMFLNTVLAIVALRDAPSASGATIGRTMHGS